MKFPTIALLLALSAPPVSASAYNGDTILNTLLIEENVVAISGDRRQPIQRYRRRLVPPSMQQQRELHPHQSSSFYSLCSCSPTTFQLRLDFSKDCSFDTIKTNAGIRGTLCLLGEAGDVGVGPLLPIPIPIPSPPPVPSTSETIPPLATIPPVASTIITGAPTSSTSFIETLPLPPPTDVTEGDDVSDGETTNTDVPVDTYYPTFSPTISPTSINDVTEESRGASRGKGKGATKEANRDSTGNKNNNDNKADASLKWIFSGTLDKEEPSIPTYHPTAVEAITPYPTDDGTYAPTVPNTYQSSLFTTYAPTTASHAKNLEEHTTTATTTSSSSKESFRRRLLPQEKTNSIIDQWTSIPPNDEFFRKFPEWKSRQEEIYQLKRSIVGDAAVGEAVLEHSSRRTLQEEETPTSFPTYLTTTEDDNDDDTTTIPISITTEDNSGGSSSSMMSLIPNKLLSAQFLEMDTSPNMNIINQDDQYINFALTDPSASSLSSITSYTLSYTSISAYLNPQIPLDKQLEYVPGGAILILVGQAQSGEIVRNRIMWTYTMGCNADDITVEVGDVFGWTMFDNLNPAIPEFCPASSGGGESGSSIPTYMPTTDAVSASSKSSKHHKHSSSSSKSSKHHKPSSSSEDEVHESNSKSGKPELSMPSGDLVDHFNFGKSGKSSSHHSKTSKTSSSHSEDEESSKDKDEPSKDEYKPPKDEDEPPTDEDKPPEEDDEEPSEDDIASMPSSRLLYIDVQYPQDFDLNQPVPDDEKEGVEEFNEVFGRRLTKHSRETTLRKGVSIVKTKVKDQRFDKPLKKRLRDRSV